MNRFAFFQRRPFLGLIAAGWVVALAACAQMPATNMVSFGASMSAANEVPPNSSPAMGTVEASYDKSTRTLSYKIVYSGLTGPAIMAHFHGPAMAGANAGVVVPFATPASPIEGKAQLTQAQEDDLMAGKWYANVHTAANKGGEIRGQLMPKM